MKQIAALSIAALMIAIASAAYSQSLADLANKEKERRAKIGAATKVITNEEAAKYKGGAVTTATLPSQPSPKADEGKKEGGTETSSQKPKAELDEPVDFKSRPESFWRKTMADARKNVKDCENAANAHTLKLADLQTQFYREDDGFKREGIQREMQKAYYEQDLNKENLTKAKSILLDLEKEARKSGALPGWIEP